MQAYSFGIRWHPTIGEIPLQWFWAISVVLECVCSLSGISSCRQDDGWIRIVSVDMINLQMVFFNWIFLFSKPTKVILIKNIKLSIKRKRLWDTHFLIWKGVSIQYNSVIIDNERSHISSLRFSHKKTLRNIRFCTRQRELEWGLNFEWNWSAKEAETISE